MTLDRRDAASAPRVGALEPPSSRLARPATESLPDPACCDCCAALIKGLAAIRLELHQLNERMSQAESQQAWSA
jgi:hypothetical protein